MPIPYLKSKAELEQYTQSCDALVLYFTASWCGPCQAIAPMMEQHYTSFPNVEMVKVDLDTHRQVATQYTISAVPTFVFLEKGQEVARIRGAGVQELYTKIQELSRKVPQGKRLVDAGVDSAQKDTPEMKEIAGLVSKGAKLLNKTILFGEFESLNTVPLTNGDDVKDLVRMDQEKKGMAVMSDADSQLLLHIPFTNVCKVSSILIKAKEHPDTQRPTRVKVWCNRTAIISFEDAESLNALHDQELHFDANGWCELALKFVRFQKVTSLDLFFDGEDEDEHTVLDRVLIVGVDGESRDQGKLDRGEDH